jgi:hypothetical protein
MSDKNYDMRAIRAPWYSGVQFLIKQDSYVVDKIEMREVHSGDQVEPTGLLSNEQAQTLMDDLWNCGLRPTEGSGSAGSLAATERHLKDMRAIVFKEFPGGLPK